MTEKKICVTIVVQKDIGVEMKYLSSQDIKNRQRNISDIKPYKTTKEIVVSNIFTFFNAMNLALAVLVATTLRFENMLFLGVIAINTAIGIFQEVRSKNALEKLSLLGKSKYRVNRDGQTIEIDPEDIVLGEYLHLNLGDQVPVDAEVLEGNVEVDESLLTGESDSIFKTVGDKLMSGAMLSAVLVWSLLQLWVPIVISTNLQNPARNSKNTLLNCAIIWIRF